MGRVVSCGLKELHKFPTGQKVVAHLHCRCDNCDSEYTRDSHGEVRCIAAPDWEQDYSL